MNALLVTLYVVGYLAAVPLLLPMARDDDMVRPDLAAAFFALFWPVLGAMGAAWFVLTTLGAYGRWAERKVARR